MMLSLMEYIKLHILPQHAFCDKHSEEYFLKEKYKPQNNKRKTVGYFNNAFCFDVTESRFEQDSLYSTCFIHVEK